MDYEKTYTDFYSRYYDKMEFIIKKYLIINYNNKKSFNKIFNELSIKVVDYKETKYKHILEDKTLNDLYKTFLNKNEIYFTDAINEIFSNEIKKEFELLTKSDKSITYSFRNLIIDFAILDVISEIKRLLSNNSRIIELAYELNRFDLFEIRYYAGISIENYPVYLLLSDIKYPKENIDKNLINQNLYLGQPSNSKANSLFDFLVENYRPNEKTNIKFINILHFLKKDVDKNIYIYNLKQKEYLELVKNKFQITIKKFAKSESYHEKEKPILSSLESSFRALRGEK